MEKIKTSFGVGYINDKHGKDSVQYCVIKKSDLQIILNHFNKYPLITQKLADFLLFKSAVEILVRKQHLTISGLHRLLAIKASINNGLSDQFKIAFPNIYPIPRPLIRGQEIKDPYWISGFASAEGCFFIDITRAETRIGFSVQMKFYITQHSRDAQLLKGLVQYFNCGSYVPVLDKNIGYFIVSKFSDIIDVIIPFFDQYPILGVKAKDFQDFKRVALIMKSKDHLSQEGLEQIRLIKAGMNKNRSNIEDSPLNYSIHVTRSPPSYYFFSAFFGSLVYGIGLASKK